MGIQIPEQVGGRGASVSSAGGTIQRKSRLGTEAAFAEGSNAVFNGMRSLCMTTVDGSVHRVYADQPAGSETLVSLVCGSGEFLAKQIGIQQYAINQTVYLRIDPAKLNIYDKAGGNLVKLAQ